MQRVILISCGKRKAATPQPAHLLYTSSLFKLSLAWAKKQCPDAICILSAKHGLLTLDAVTAPYEQTLTRQTEQTWAKQVIQNLGTLYNPATTEFTLLAGARYVRALLPYLPHTAQPLKGLGLGKRLAFLKSQL